MDKGKFGRIRRRPTRPTPNPDKPVSKENAPPSQKRSGKPQPDRRTISQRRDPQRSQARSGRRPDEQVSRRPLERKPEGKRSSQDSRERNRRPQSSHQSRRPPQSSRPTQHRKTPQSNLKLESIALPVLTMMIGTAFLYYAAPILVPLVAAIALAYVLSPLVDLLKKIRLPHVLAVLIVMFVGAALLSGATYLIGQESVKLAGDLPGYYETVKGWLGGLIIDYQALQESVGNLLPTLDKSLIDNIDVTDFSGVGQYLFKGLGSVLNSVLGMIMVLLLTLFILLDQDALGKRIQPLLGSDNRLSSAIIATINDQIRGFLLVRFLTTIALSVIFTVGLLLFGVNYAYVWGPLAGVLNLIPYVGAFIGMVPPVIVAAVQTGDFVIPAWVLIFFVVVQLLESNVITPKLVGDKVNLNLLAVLVATVYWGWLWGMLGVLLAVPITGAIKVVCTHIEQLRPIAVLLGGEEDLRGRRKSR